MAKQRIPLVGSIVNRNENALSYGDYDQRFNNCFPEVSRNPITGKGSVHLVKRNGFPAQDCAPASYVGLSGSCVWSGKGSGQAALFCYINGTTLAVYQTNGTIVGSTISDVTGRSRLNETYITNGGTSQVSYLTLVAQKSTTNISHAWFFTESGSWTEITSGNFPTKQNGTGTGSITGTTLDVTVSSSGVNLAVGDFVNGTGVTVGTRITSIGTAVAGVGTYGVSISHTGTGSVSLVFGRILVGNMVHMDGYAFVMDSTGRIWNSDLNSLANWSSTSWIETQESPDGGSGLAVLNNVLIAFGPRSIQFFQNAGNATGSPLQPIQSATVHIGARAYGENNSETVKVIGDSCYFVGVSADTGAYGVYRITGTKVTKISTPAVDKALSQAADSDNHRGIAGSMVLHAMQHVLLYTGNGEQQFAYCIDTNTWWYFELALSEVVEAAIGMDGKSFLTVSTNATAQGRKIYQASPANVNYSDNNNQNYSMIVRTGLIDFGTDALKEYRSFSLIADSQSISGTVLISFSDNDFQTFSSAKSLAVSTGQQKKIDAGLGWSRRRSWKIQEQNPRPFRAEAFDVEWEESEE